MLLPTGKCYPINYGGYEQFYKENTGDVINKRMSDNKSFFIHIWNKMTELQSKFSEKLNIDSKIGYIMLAEKMCPRVLQSLKKGF